MYAMNVGNIMMIVSVLLIVFLSLTTNILSQVQFTTHIITPGAGTTDNATYVLAFDVESDGDVDIVSSSWLDNKIAWYENDGNQAFTQHIIYDDAPGASWLYAIDMDEDEDIDVLSTAMLEDRVYWYENDGQGIFTTHVVDSSINPNGWLRFSVCVYDVDSDGDMDVMSGSWDKTEIKWHENDGNQNFTTRPISNSPFNCGLIYVANVENDGDLDILTATGGQNMVGWLENDGNEHFNFHVITTDAYFADTVWGVDVDSDGDRDVLSAALYGDEIAWYENSLKTPVISPVPDSAQVEYVVGGITFVEGPLWHPNGFLL
jgi:hypothetical protein